MTLPNRPSISDSIPNTPFASSEESLIKGPYWYMEVGGGLSVSNGNLFVPGQGLGEASSYLYGPNGFVGVTGALEINKNGELVVKDFGQITYITPAPFPITNNQFFVDAGNPLSNTASEVVFIVSLTVTPPEGYRPGIVKANIQDGQITYYTEIVDPGNGFAYSQLVEVNISTSAPGQSNASQAEPALAIANPAT